MQEPHNTARTEPTVVAAMWRGLDIFRPTAWVYALYSAFARHPGMARPWLVPGGIGSPPSARSGHAVATFCEDAAVVGWAVLRGWRTGMLAAFLVGVADLLEVGVATQTALDTSTVNNIVILVLLGGCIGYCADLSRDGHAALSEALRVQAEVRERDRLARTVHDGVLQTLSLIHRRGTDLGGGAGELAALAADQERLLRALVSRVPGAPAPGDSHLAAGAVGQVDLRSVLGRYADRAVNVIPPAGPVLMAASVAEELAAAVSAALDNVRLHAGADAQAWILIEDKGRDVTVTIRDNGVGVPAGRLAEAAISGRMGMTDSIVGRMGELGGTTTFESRPGAGTCLELTVSKNGSEP